MLNSFPKCDSFNISSIFFSPKNSKEYHIFPILNLCIYYEILVIYRKLQFTIVNFGRDCLSEKQLDFCKKRRHYWDCFLHWVNGWLPPQLQDLDLEQIGNDNGRSTSWTHLILLSLITSRLILTSIKSSINVKFISIRPDPVKLILEN